MNFLSLNPPTASSRSYLVADGQEAMIVDPVSEFVDAYDAELVKRHLRLVAVVDTHTHADHVSGAAELSRRTGAPLMMHHQAPRACVHRRVRDGDEVVVGSTRARVLATPGHTYDSISLLLRDRILTGDVLDVGPTGHSDESCSDVEAWEESVQQLRKLEPTLAVFGTHADPSTPRVLMAALAEARKRRFAQPVSGSGSRLGSDFRRPSDGASFDALRANLACASVPRTQTAVVGDRGVQRVKPSELVEALRSSDAPHVIDVRSVDEYFDASLGRVPGALLVPLEHLEAEGAALRSLGGGLVVSCRTTARAVLAASVLLDQGMQDVRVLEGGVLAWKAEGHPVELG
jgi:glyoxylase-like metal-dependent hydrolase (beta-lactamase superfamily II)/rhodanese-related sulfurtransferase